ncbi:MAG: arginine--tRNA ligase [Alphaproteobacteria bacterium]|nr:arginine--tRNA ligase [Alphaproteobacteria bacterium]
MHIFTYFNLILVSFLEQLAQDYGISEPLDKTKIYSEPPKDNKHGDLTTNVALIYSKLFKINPKVLAEKFQILLQKREEIKKCEIAGPGFINLWVHDKFWHAALRTILEEKLNYGSSQIGHNISVNVEYVSANPTGPLHLAHARGAIVGDALAALLAKAGYSVTREYYINDAGAQVKAVAHSTYLRYREACGEIIDQIPEGLYPGDYLKDVAQKLFKRDGTKWLKSPEDQWYPVILDFALKEIMSMIREDLRALGIHHDNFVSEYQLIQAGRVEEVVKLLEQKELIYTGTLPPPKGGENQEDWEPRPQMLFKSTEYGDEIDRPLKKSDGSWTYFASDIAYHFDKFKRGHKVLIDVVGADHGGYVKRMGAAVAAMTDKTVDLDIKLCQMVRLLRDGELIKMSKRAGTFVTLKEVIQEVGSDVIRFIMLTRKNDAQLDFDLKKVTDQSKDNPVFYVQYAHARACSVLRHAVELGNDWQKDDTFFTKSEVNLLVDEYELMLIKLLASWPLMVEAAALAKEPHRIAYYLFDVAAAFHALWNKGKDNTTMRFILDNQPNLTQARLSLVRAVSLIIKNGLAVMGITAIEEMH